MITQLAQLTGIGPGLASRIRWHFGDEQEALKALLENPYALMEVDGIGFRRADKIAQAHYRVSEDDPIRHRYGNPYILREAGGKLSDSDFYERRWSLGLQDNQYRYSGVVRDSELPGDWVWLEEELEAERLIAKYLDDYDHAFAEYGDGPIAQHLNADQQKAVQLIFGPPMVSCVTGGAGTGKTTVIAEAIRLLGRGQAQIMTFAGKAAQRCAQALAERGLEDYAPCSTIHRGLEYRPGYGFTKGYFSEALIILDEASMIPTWLLAEVVKRLNGAKLVLVGDAGQLPPIGLGFPFRDFMALGVPTVKLAQNYRQAERRALYELCEAVRVRKAAQPEHDSPNLEVINSLSPSLFNRHCEAIFYSPELQDLNSWQAITFKNADRELMNLELQGIYNPAGAVVFEYPTRALKGEYRQTCQVRIGDKVAVRANNYSLEVFNGQTGFVLGVEQPTNPEEFASVIVQIEERKISIPLELAVDLLELAYCITCHKAQGSGWPQIIILQPESVGLSPHRWWYTAVSRAEQKLTILTYMPRKTWWANCIRYTPDEPSSLVARVKVYEREPREEINNLPDSFIEVGA